MNIKTIIVDLDRTLLHTDKSISPYTVSILKKCKKNDILLMAATARPLRDIKKRVGIIDFDALAVSNGARVICNGRRTEYKIPTETAVRLLKTLEHRNSLRITLETGDIAYSNVSFEDYESVLCNDMVSVAKSEGVLKLIVGIDSEDLVEDVKKELSPDLYFTIANGHLMQIMSKSATKWNGIKQMLELCGCSTDETAYFGDDYDDIEPIKMCGIGVAVSNAIDEVKSAADYVTESNDNDGVARFIEKMPGFRFRNTCFDS